MIEKIYRDLLRDEKISEDIEKFNINKQKILEDAKKSLTLKDRVYISRFEKRAKTKDFIENIITDPIYLHGDRKFSDDKAVIGGIGKLNDIVVTFIGIDKGNCLENSIKNNFGMASPDGYRKAIRLMKEAEKFKRPIVVFVDTPGAFPGIDAEERGQAEAIASSILNMTSLKVPIISVITGEGCSGGAIGLCVCDYLIMLENATYSILSPEGFASILWKDSRKMEDAIKLMKLTSEDLYDFKICDEVIEEDLGINIEDFKENFSRLKNSIYLSLKKLIWEDTDVLLENRRRKYEI